MEALQQVVTDAAAQVEQKTEVRLRPAVLYSMNDLATLWARAYADYFVDAALDERRFQTYVDLHDIDLARSMVLETRDHDFVGLSLLGIRGARGWIGAFGIEPEHRRQGYSRLLLRSQIALARGAGLGSLQLEVAMESWARATYERAGFAQSRLLYVSRGRVRTSEKGVGVVVTTPEAALDQIQQMRCGSVWPWQREFTTIRHSISSATVGLAIDRAAGPLGSMICERTANATIRVLDLAGEAWTVGPLLARARELFGDCEVVLVNEPSDSEMQPYLLTAGLKVSRMRREMLLHLDLPE